MREVKLDLSDYSTIKIGNNGVIFHLHQGKHEGKLIVKKTGIEWRKGRSQTGVNLRWEDLIDYMNERNQS